MSFVRQHSGAVVWSLALHVAIVAALGMTIRWPSHAPMPAAMAPIEGTIIDGAAIVREQKARDEAARQERARVERAERQKREAAETAQREKAAAEQRERDRIALDKRRKEQEEQARVAEQKRQEQQAREEAAKREREATERRRQQQAEAELQQALAAEGERLEAERNGQLDQYVRMIEAAIELKWNRPLSAKAGLDCIINVVQLPTGDVVSAKMENCNGDPIVVQSIEAAVRNASPLPKPPVPSLFERNLRVRFHPDL